MEPVFFANQYEFRNWLIDNHLTASELLVGFYKVDSGKPSMSWSESVDQALCFGWIDSIRRTVDEVSYTIRFTKRRKNSIWSAVNIAKIEKMTAEGLMYQAGIDAFNSRNPEKCEVYSFEKVVVELSDEFLELFKSDKEAWEFFSKQAPSYQRTIKHWVMSAKQQTTRLNRMEKLISFSRNRQKIF
jgi:uncharacterized protein YdeI (YjbR/CyaY-like superfamily)